MIDLQTKCDRGSPCSSCVAAELSCQITRRAPEKRQRVLISARYDQAMESVDRSLQDVSRSLQKLLQKSEQTQDSPKSSTGTVISSNVSNKMILSEGYRGDSSFKAHVQKVTDALRDAATNLEFSMTDPDFDGTVSATRIVEEANMEETTPNTIESTATSLLVQFPQLEGRSLPPIDPVLKLLRWAQVEKQRFFIDFPFLDEHEFGELCQKVYFAINNYSLASWATVNIGLYYLLFSLGSHHYTQIGMTASDIETNLLLLSENLQAVLQSWRLCQDPSMESCQALALLVSDMPNSFCFLLTV